MDNRTIAAISSGMVTSGIGIIRISGSDAVAVVDRVFCAAGAEPKDGSWVKLANRPSHTVNYGIICDGDEKIDEAIVLIMRAPKSFTGEDTVEIQCHGGPFVMRRVLEAVINAGADMAEPGEFTKRAFLNGKMDLSEAESVMSLIEAKSEYAMKASFASLKGAISREISDIRSKIIYDAAYLEAALDDPEHISLEGFGKRLLKTVDEAGLRISLLIKKADEGKVLREGVRTVILGKPNAGKSTLLNLILGEERAIVTDKPGTTRDTLEESARIGEIVLNLVDTAGLRDADDEVEKIGVDRALKEAEEAELVLYVVDACNGPAAEEIDAVNSYDKAVVIFNKYDKVENDTNYSLKHPIVKMSAKFDENVDELASVIKNMFISGEISTSEDLMIANTRQKKLLKAALDALGKVREGLEIGVPEDLLTVDLMDAYNNLGMITGEVASEALADEIFDKFCMGK